MSNSPAGWYPDSQNQALVRYWDGLQWTSHTQPSQSQESVAVLHQEQATPSTNVDMPTGWQTTLHSLEVSLEEPVVVPEEIPGIIRRNPEIETYFYAFGGTGADQSLFAPGNINELLKDGYGVDPSAYAEHVEILAEVWEYFNRIRSGLAGRPLVEQAYAMVHFNLDTMRRFVPDALADDDLMNDILVDQFPSVNNSPEKLEVIRGRFRAEGLWA